MAEHALVEAISNQNVVQSTNSYIGFTTAVLELLNSSNPVHTLARSIIKWLGREHIAESDFEFTIQQSRGVTYPNEKGLTIRKDLQSSHSKMKRVGGIHLISAGTIGRWMALSQEHVYMVTTVAALTRYHGMGFISRLFCDMIRMHNNPSTCTPMNCGKYSVEKTRLFGVLSKIVESITLNVVNAGHALGDIPEELQSFCVHLLPATELARAILTISQSRRDILVLSTKFLGDILLWVLAHFEGNIEVTVAHKRVFRREHPAEKRTFLMLVQTTCKEDEDCHRTRYRVEVSELVGSTWTEVLRIRDEHSIKGTNYQRQALYTIEFPDGSRRKDILNRELSRKAEILAQKFVVWMMDVQLKELDHNVTHRLGFRAVFDLETTENDALHIGDVLHRWPSFLHERLGSISGARVSFVFVPLSREEQPRSSNTLTENETGILSLISGCFPSLIDFLEEDVLNSCNCRICRNKGPIDDCKEGCLRDAAVSRLFVLIGNAIADGFGVQDISGIINLHDYVKCVQHLLWNLVQGYVWWDDWFNVGASTALGYPQTRWQKPPIRKGYVYEHEEMIESGSAVVAIQYNSIVAAAKWLDLNQKITLHNCFALEMAEGQIDGIEEGCCFFQSEPDIPDYESELSAESTYESGDCLERWADDIAERDQTEASLQNAVFMSRETEIGRIITLVSVGDFRRIIDPAYVLMGVLRSRFLSREPRSCQHGSESMWPNKGDATVWHVWSLNQVIAQWDSWEVDDAVLFTKKLDSYLNLNTALALSPTGCLVRNDNFCLLCVIDILENYPTGFIPRMINCDISEHALVQR